MAGNVQLERYLACLTIRDWLSLWDLGPGPCQGPAAERACSPGFTGGCQTLLTGHCLVQALATCAQMRPPIDISVGGDNSTEGVGAGGARTSYSSSAATTS